MLPKPGRSSPVALPRCRSAGRRSLRSKWPSRPRDSALRPQPRPMPARSRLLQPPRLLPLLLSPRLPSSLPPRLSQRHQTSSVWHPLPPRRPSPHSRTGRTALLPRLRLLLPLRHPPLSPNRPRRRSPRLPLPHLPRFLPHSLRRHRLPLLRLRPPLRKIHSPTPSPSASLSCAPSSASIGK